jgi:glycosyltransferase involved in cell wall biosynthesis
MVPPSLARVDVVIAVMDGLPYVVETVESVLAQEGVTAFVIVVDDGSSDGTPERLALMDARRVRVISGHGHESTCAARNRGIAASSAPWLAFLDADDLWPPRRTSDLLAVIQDPEEDIAVGYVEEFTGEAPAVGHGAPASPGSRVGLCVGGTLTSRRLLDRVGYFDESLRVGEYVDWLARARSLGMRERVSPTVSLLRRVHDRNTSRERRADYAQDVMTIVKRHRLRGAT